MSQSPQSSIKKILIANRGEIARRIQATAHAYGIKTVAIYTEEDRFGSYVYTAHESYPLSHVGAAGYLDQETIIGIAKNANVDAIHPGYGFLSENGDFARRAIGAGLIWIGPTPEQIKLLGDKAVAQKVMREAHVSTIPGDCFIAASTKEQGYTLNLVKAYQYAQEIGFPILLKCAHGGGGKSMRIVTKKEDFENTWNTVASEAKRFFDSSTILVEKQIKHPRHIEIQVAGDGKNFIHLFERECSLQRRHQKIIEESPSQFVSQKTKNMLYKAALDVAKTVSYENIGTVEFLVDADENFYFLEMNTRLQVEHSVTESITGIDLVALQLTIASEKKLPYTQDDISHHGHAIECRLYAENPEKNFAPSTGIIKNLTLPHQPEVRIDHDLEEGRGITPFFDPMLAKITTHTFSRKESIIKMFAALETINISGITTNIDFLQKLLTTKEFLAGDIHTQLLQNKTYLEKTFATQVVSQQEPLILTEQEKEILAKAVKNLLQQRQSLFGEIELESASKDTPYPKPTGKFNLPSSWKEEQWK